MRARQAQAEARDWRDHRHDEEPRTLREAMAMTAEIHDAPCPQCGQAVSVTLTTSEVGDQLAADRTTCPSCGASLVRAVEGHADQRWRAEDESGA